MVGALAYRLGAFPKRAVGGVVPIDRIKEASDSTAARIGEGIEPIGTPLVTSGMSQPVREWLLPQLGVPGIDSTAGGGVDRSLPAPELRAGSPVGVSA